MGKGDDGPSEQDLIGQQIDIQKILANLSTENAAYGRSLLGPAADYWQSLLQGGQAARVAVGPTAQLIGQSGDATRRSIMESAPAGGQRDKALLQSRLGEQSDTARLYSGVQPMAAQNLTTIAGVPYGVSVGFAGSASPNIGASFQSMNAQSDRNAGAWSNVGRLAYNMFGGGRSMGDFTSSGSGTSGKDKGGNTGGYS